MKSTSIKPDPDKRQARADRKVSTGKPRLVKKFGYNTVEAEKAGLGPDESGHWPSRNPENGMILKGRKHPTIKQTLDAEKSLGFKVTKKKGTYYSNPPNMKSTTLKRRAPSIDVKPKAPEKPKTGPTTRSIKTSGGGGYKSTYQRKSP